MNLTTDRLFTIAAVIELVTGVGLILVPVFVLHLVIGAGTNSVGVEVARLAGIALFCLGVLCWFSRSSPDPLPGLAAMLTYNALATAFFLYLGSMGQAGLLLWPIVLVHGVLSVFFLQHLRAP